MKGPSYLQAADFTHRDSSMMAFSNKGISFSRRTSLVLTYAIPAMLSTTDLRTFQIGSLASFR